MFEPKNLGPLAQKFKFARFALHAFSQNCSTCTNHNSLNFCHMKMILDFLETSRFLVNINILKSYSSFDQGQIMIHQENSRFIKSQKLLNQGFLKEKSTELQPSITFTCFMKFFLTKAHFKGNSNLYNFVSLNSSSKNTSFERYGSKHYRSFRKSTKTHLLLKQFTKR